MSSYRSAASTGQLHLDRDVYPKTLAKYAELILINREFEKVLARGSRYEVTAMSKAVAKTRAELDEAYMRELAADHMKTGKLLA